MASKKPSDHGTGIPLHEVEALARVLLPEIQKFFESEEGQKEFREWKKRRETKPQSTTTVGAIVMRCARLSHFFF